MCVYICIFVLYKRMLSSAIQSCLFSFVHAIITKLKFRKVLVIIENINTNRKTFMLVIPLNIVV